MTEGGDGRVSMLTSVNLLSIISLTPPLRIWAWWEFCSCSLGWATSHHLHSYPWVWATIISPPGFYRSSLPSFSAAFLARAIFKHCKSDHAASLLKIIPIILPKNKLPTPNFVLRDSTWSGPIYFSYLVTCHILPYQCGSATLAFFCFFRSSKLVPASGPLHLLPDCSGCSGQLFPIFYLYNQMLLPQRGFPTCVREHHPPAGYLCLPPYI